MIEELLERLIDAQEHRYFGKHRGYVHQVDDPLQMGRIRVFVPRLLGETPTGWAMPCSPYAGPDQGFFAIPDVGAAVWVEFEGGDLSRPIWTGMWWGRPSTQDVQSSDSTASEHRTDPEVPRHNTPRETAAPDVRILKSSAGHHMVMDDRKDTERLEIEDSGGNRLILSAKKGFDRLIFNERTVNRGARSAQIAASDTTHISGNQTETVGGRHTRTVKGDLTHNVTGELNQSIFGGGFVRTVNGSGTTTLIGGNRTDVVRGEHMRTVVGRSSEFAVGGYSVTAGGPVNIGSATSLSFGAALPAVPPSLTAMSINSLMGNISLNTMLGICQIGGLTAFSPLVLGDGLMMHFSLLVVILKTINPLTVMVYGPLLDVWLAMMPVLDLSYFAFVKRFPVG